MHDATGNGLERTMSLFIDFPPSSKTRVLYPPGASVLSSASLTFLARTPHTVAGTVSVLEYPNFLNQSDFPGLPPALRTLSLFSSLLR